MNGGLLVKDSKEYTLFETNKEIFEIRNVNLYSDEYYTIESVFDEAIKDGVFKQ